MLSKYQFNYFISIGQNMDVHTLTALMLLFSNYGRADKSLARPGRKQARKHVRDARDFNNIETRPVIKFPSPPHSPQGKAPKEFHAIS